MQDRSPESPEARGRRLAWARKHLDRTFHEERRNRYLEVVKRVAVGVYSDGFIHAGNLAYLSILTLFPFFIVAAAIARLFGQSQDGLAAVQAFLRTVPPGVAELLSKPIADVLAARSGSLLWFGALVGLWTTGSLIETIRDILRRAYGVTFTHPFWSYRLGSMGLIVGAVILTMIAFTVQVMLVGVEEFINHVLPYASDTTGFITALRTAPGVALFVALYIVFYSLTPGKYRLSDCPKWPGAAFTTLWWLATTALLPRVIGSIGSYDLTYGSLAGVMIALIFFFLVGLGLVIGAELNAALAENPDSGQRDADDGEEDGETPK